MPKFDVSVLLAFATIFQVVCGESNVRFYLSTRRNAQEPQELTADVESIVRSSYYALNPTIISIPRWQGSSESKENHIVTESQLKKENSNVIVADLSEIQTETPSVDNITAVALEVSNLIMELYNQFDVPTTHIRLIGFSEGAHIAGEVGEIIKLQVNTKIQQITALDPTSYELTQLSSDAAQFVEVIHTNSDGKGTLDLLGHVDFYPNGGRKQPNCENKDIDVNQCSHERAYELVQDMWSPENNFLAANCVSTENMSANNCLWTTNVKMGQKTDSYGIYYLDTNGDKPYGKGSYHIAFL